VLQFWYCSSERWCHQLQSQLPSNAIEFLPYRRIRLPVSKRGIQQEEQQLRETNLRLGTIRNKNDVQAYRHVILGVTILATEKVPGTKSAWLSDYSGQ
jgi:hypothetical protein